MHHALNCIMYLSETHTWNGFVYDVVDTKATWFDAEDYCVEHGGHLPVITSQQEFDFLLQFTSEGYNRYPDVCQKKKTTCRTGKAVHG